MIIQNYKGYNKFLIIIIFITCYGVVTKINKIKINKELQ